MFYRQTQQIVQKALTRQASVALIGPRQVGKTTLALSIAQEQNALHLDLESSEDRSKLANPTAFLTSFEDRLVIMDEIHRVPDLFLTLRGLIDQGRSRGKRVGRFLLLGSASLDLMLQGGESLAGRISYIDMTPLTVQEIPSIELQSLWIRGGFPDSFLAPDDHLSMDWRKDLLRTYLERDGAHVWLAHSS